MTKLSDELSYSGVEPLPVITDLAGPRGTSRDLAGPRGRSGENSGSDQIWVNSLLNFGGSAGSVGRVGRSVGSGPKFGRSGPKFGMHAMRVYCSVEMRAAQCRNASGPSERPKRPKNGIELTLVSILLIGMGLS